MSGGLFAEGGGWGLDMVRLSLMDHLMLTLGTFGWWGRYLSDARDIYHYSNWPRKGTSLHAEISRVDFYPDHWKSFGD